MKRTFFNFLSSVLRVTPFIEFCLLGCCGTVAMKMIRLALHPQLREVLFDFLHLGDQLELRLVHHRVRQSVEQFALELCKEWFQMYRSDPFGDRFRGASQYLEIARPRSERALRFSHHTRIMAGSGLKTAPIWLLILIWDYVFSEGSATLFSGKKRRHLCRKRQDDAQESLLMLKLDENQMIELFSNAKAICVGDFAACDINESDSETDSFSSNSSIDPDEEMPLRLHAFEVALQHCAGDVVEIDCNDVVGCDSHEVGAMKAVARNVQRFPQLQMLDVGKVPLIKGGRFEMMLQRDIIPKLPSLQSVAAQLDPTATGAMKYSMDWQVGSLVLDDDCAVRSTELPSYGLLVRLLSADLTSTRLEDRAMLAHLNNLEVLLVDSSQHGLSRPNAAGLLEAMRPQRLAVLELYAVSTSPVALNGFLRHASPTLERLTLIHAVESSAVSATLQEVYTHCTSLKALAFIVGEHKGIDLEPLSSLTCLIAGLEYLVTDINLSSPIQNNVASLSDVRLQGEASCTGAVRLLAAGTRWLRRLELDGILETSAERDELFIGIMRRNAQLDFISLALHDTSAFAKALSESPCRFVLSYLNVRSHHATTFEDATQIARSCFYLENLTFSYLIAERYEERVLTKLLPFGCMLRYST